MKFSVHGTIFLFLAFTVKKKRWQELVNSQHFKSSTKLTDYSCVQQPVSVQTPPPVDPAAQGTNQSPPAPALSPDQARKPGQNFRCLWQACKR